MFALKHPVDEDPDTSDEAGLDQKIFELSRNMVSVRMPQRNPSHDTSSINHKRMLHDGKDTPKHTNVSEGIATADLRPRIGKPNVKVATLKFSTVCLSKAPVLLGDTAIDDGEHTDQTHYEDEDQLKRWSLDHHFSKSKIFTDLLATEPKILEGPLSLLSGASEIQNIVKGLESSQNVQRNTYDQLTHKLIANQPVLASLPHMHQQHHDDHKKRIRLVRKKPKLH